MKLTLIGSPDSNDNWTCKDSRGMTHRVDFFINNEELRNILKEGDIVEVEYLQPYIEISSKIISESEKEESDGKP